jgi:hypothetical protein
VTPNCFTASLVYFGLKLSPTQNKIGLIVNPLLCFDPRNAGCVSVRSRMVTLLFEIVVDLGVESLDES